MARTKRSQAGKVTQVLGNNNYLVEVDGCEKHLSGDVLSKQRVGTFRTPISAENVSQGAEARQHGEGSDGEIQDEDIDQDMDTASISSESSEGSVDSVFGVRGPVMLPQQREDVRQPRRRRRQVELLGQPAQLPGQRLRPRNRN